MYEQGDRVLRKDISNGIEAGFVLRSWILPYDEETLRVKWFASQRRSTLKASAVLSHTPENVKTLEDRLDKREAKRLAAQEAK